MVFQGANDPRVPWSEGRADGGARSAARATEVWYVLAKDEGHGFPKKQNRDALREAETLFLKKVLGLTARWEGRVRGAAVGRVRASHAKRRGPPHPTLSPRRGERLGATVRTALTDFRSYERAELRRTGGRCGWSGRTGRARRTSWRR